MYDMFYLLPIFLIFLISYSNLLNKFYSRKLVHLGCGIILAKINEPKIPLKYIIELIAILSIISCFILPFPFSRKYDLGVITYNLSILFFIWFNIPLRILLPMFIIDPMASIIGINFNSPIWIHTKTIYGTITCMIFSYITLYYIMNKYHRIIMSLILALTEGFLEKNDNLGIIIVISIYYFISLHYNFPINLNLPINFKFPLHFNFIH